MLVAHSSTEPAADTRTTAVACQEVKKRNITVWIIGFGTTLTPVMTACAGNGHSFEASNAAELSSVFAKIASQMGELRIAL